MASKTYVKKIVSTEKGGKPIGNFSQAVIVDNRMYTAGQLGIDPATGELVSGGLLPEAEQTFKNMSAVLESAGVGFDNIVKTTVFLADINEWPTFNEIYAKYFTGAFPARSAFQVGALPRGARVEMEAVVVLGQITDTI